jgi:cytochrome c
MDSFEMNKLLGAVLGTCLVLVALNIAAGAVFAPVKPAMPGYDIKVPDHPAGTNTTAPPAQEEPPIGPLLASADVARGQEAATKNCAGCHTFEKGGAKKVGPNLWGVVGRMKAAMADYNYSTAMKGKGGAWSLDDINHFIVNPRAMIPGTNMTFGGVSRPSERADILAYLNSLSDSPAPLPKAELAPATRLAAQ